MNTRTRDAARAEAAALMEQADLASGFASFARRPADRRRLAKIASDTRARAWRILDTFDPMPAELASMDSDALYLELTQ